METARQVAIGGCICIDSGSTPDQPRWSTTLWNLLVVAVNAVLGWCRHVCGDRVVGQGKAGLAARLFAAHSRHSLARHLRADVRFDRCRSVRGRLPTLGQQRFTRSGRGDCRYRWQNQSSLWRSRCHRAASGFGLCRRCRAGAGQRATAEKSNEITAIPELLSTLSLAGCTVTIDAMGTQTAIAEPFRSAEPTTCWPSRTTSPNWPSR
jgi:hypothetical protein